MNKPSEDAFYDIRPYPWIEENPQIDHLLNLQGLTIFPFYWSVLHILAIYEKHQAINEFLNHRSFKPCYKMFMPDKYGNTPLHYLIYQTHIDYSSLTLIFDKMLNYSSEDASSIEYFTIMQSLV